MSTKRDVAHDKSVPHNLRPDGQELSEQIIIIFGGKIFSSFARESGVGMHVPRCVIATGSGFGYPVLERMLLDGVLTE